MANDKVEYCEAAEVGPLVCPSKVKLLDREWIALPSAAVFIALICGRPFSKAEVAS